MEKTEKKLPSKAQVGDSVIVNFFDSGKVLGARVYAVRFEEDKVYYDLSIILTKDVATLIEHVDSVCVEVVEEENER